MRVSLTMIVKDEEANLPGSLGAVADLVDERIVVDTGSTDRTREVAAGLGAVVYEFPWNDSFADARNEGIRHATGDWIFWMDADDRLDEANRQKLRALFANLHDENVAYSMACISFNFVNGVRQADILNHTRLFRRHPQLRWKWRVHEQILVTVHELGGEARGTDISIYHAGYSDAAAFAGKQERNLRLMLLDLAHDPGDGYTLFNLARTCMLLQRPADAVPYLRRCLERSIPTANYLAAAYALLAQGLRMTGDLAAAVACCQEGRGRFPNSLDLLFHESLLRIDQNDLAGAEACLLQLQRTQPDAYYTISIAPEMTGIWAQHFLGVVYQRQGRRAEAEALWRQVVAERPDFRPSWQKLEELRPAQGPAPGGLVVSW